MIYVILCGRNDFRPSRDDEIARDFMMKIWLIFREIFKRCTGLRTGCYRNRYSDRADVRCVFHRYWQAVEMGHLRPIDMITAYPLFLRS